MRYSIWTHNRMIGETDLDFVRIISRLRSGWFHPNDEGERLMPAIASPVPAIRAHLHHDAADSSGDSLVRPEMDGSTYFADVAEAFHHLSSLDLELRRDDGSVVATSDISFHDTERLIQLAELEDDDRDGSFTDGDDAPIETPERDFQLDADVRHAMGLLELEFEEEDDDPWADWTPYDFREPPDPRYQIHVKLLHDDGLP